MPDPTGLKSLAKGVFDVSPIGRLATLGEEIGAEAQRKYARGKAFVQGYLKPKAKPKPKTK